MEYRSEKQSGLVIILIACISIVLISLSNTILLATNIIDDESSINTELNRNTAQNVIDNIVNEYRLTSQLPLRRFDNEFNETTSDNIKYISEYTREDCILYKKLSIMLIDLDNDSIIAKRVIMY